MSAHVTELMFLLYLKTRHSLPFFFRMQGNSAGLRPEIFLEIECANRMASGSQIRGHHGRDRWQHATFLVQNDICTRPGVLAVALFFFSLSLSNQKMASGIGGLAASYYMRRETARVSCTWE